ncbi:MAG TPA: hypothetical protein VF469_21430 [Kofleriaceae bacterium]
MRVLMIAIALLLVSSPRAEADGVNILAGPIFGLQFGGSTDSHSVFGIEGGVGLGPERANLGFEYRDRKSFGYVELDPWFILGVSLGAGIDSDGELHPVGGVWEGLPIKYPNCDSSTTKYQAAVTLSAGYRYTGVHELYLSVKAGVSQNLCLPTD